MKHALFVLAVAGVPMWGQSPVRVYKAEVSAPFGAIPGMVALHDSQLTFIDSEKPETSFTVDKSNITNVSRMNDGIIVQLKQPVKDRIGDSTRLSLRLSVPSESTAVEQWFLTGLAAASAAAPRNAAEAKATDMDERWTYQARRDRLIGGTNGTLIVTRDRVIFESLDKAEASRRWELKDIKELKRKNPYELEITPFAGEKYDLKLAGAGMDADQFQKLVGWVTAARTAR